MVGDAALPRILTDPGYAAIYQALLTETSRLGPFEVRYRKSAVQLVRPDGAGFAAVAPGSDGLTLTVVVDTVLTSPRLSAALPVSGEAWNQRATIGAVSEVDDDVLDWLAAAYHRT
ncbi:MAG: DUF5655 domain-containing protein [Nakamurella sp.]